mmetsp:Transcript_18189/g.59776  ORF Transcript_18189/g.59776 Transcript_18189/m.59776 type:complete len:102 (+) Transcript_18189:1781-2086(+)
MSAELVGISSPSEARRKRWAVWARSATRSQIRSSRSSSKRIAGIIITGLTPTTSARASTLRGLTPTRGPTMGTEGPPWALRGRHGHLHGGGGAELNVIDDE